MSPRRREEGLQAERTRLAWRRTTLTAAVVALLLMRYAVQQPAVIIIAAATLLGWLALAYVAHRRIHALTAHPTAPAAMPVTAVAGTALALAALLTLSALSLAA